MQTITYSKPYLCRKIENTRENIAAARGKPWEKIDELYTEMKRKGFKEAVPKFRLMPGYDCLAHYLHRICICQLNKFVVCYDLDLVMNKHHLLCLTLSSKIC